MSFSKAKLKRFNDIDIGCSSPAPAKHAESLGTAVSTPTLAVAAVASASITSTSTASCSSTTSTTTSTSSTSSSSTAHPERKEQIEKFFKEAVRFASSGSREVKEFTIPKESAAKEDKKSKGLRLFRTPSLPQRLRFRHHSDATSNNNNNNNNNNSGGSSTASSTPLHSATTTPVKELSKSGSRLKGKEALQLEIRKKNELIENYMSQLDVLRRHVEQLKETEQKLRDEQANCKQSTDELIQALTKENNEQKELNEQLSAENNGLTERCAKLCIELETLTTQHAAEVAALNVLSAELKASNAKLEEDTKQQCEEHAKMQSQIAKLEQEIAEARQKLAIDEQTAQHNYELIENLKNSNNALISDVNELKRQMEHDALAYAQEHRNTQTELECLKNERNTLKNDLASKCEFIRSLQEELLDKNCEIDAHCDTIRQLCREKAKYVERERLMDSAEEKIRMAEAYAEQKIHKLESDLETAIEREKSYWRGELEKRKKLAENEIIKIELEKQDVMVMLESTNDMLRERDEKIQKYEDQLRNGIDYYVQLTDNLQKQVVDLKQEVAKIITEKYNYQLTLSNTRSTVNILMERLKKSDADVEQFKAELESVQLAKSALEQSYMSLQTEVETLRKQLTETEAALKTLRESSQALQKEVSIKESIFNEILTSEDETLAKFNKIASSFQERIDTDAAHYLALYNELKGKDDAREAYMQDMKKALDEFATVLQFAQLELDSKEKALHKVREECEQVKLENISLKSKLDESVANANRKNENTTDLEKIEGLLNDECEKITSWLINTDDKSLRNDSLNEIQELLLKPSTPNNNKSLNSNNTPVRTGHVNASNNNNNNNNNTSASITTPRTPRTPKSRQHTPRTTPKKAVALFPGKENVLSPQKQVLKARNM